MEQLVFIEKSFTELQTIVCISQIDLKQIQQILFSSKVLLGFPSSQLLPWLLEQGNNVMLYKGNFVPSSSKVSIPEFSYGGKDCWINVRTIIN